MASSFINFLVKLAEATEDKIVTSVKELNGYTLKHWAGRQPQEPHGWRYGANILRPNGMGAPSIARGKKYLGRITDRDLQDGLTGKRIAGGNANNRGIKNVHMEYQRRSRGGDSKLRRWDKGERDREYGRSLDDQRGLGTGKGGKTSAAGKNTPSNESKNQKWSLQGGPKMKPPKDGIARSPSIRGDRVHGGKGTGNPWQKQKLLVGVNRAAARKLIRGVRKSPVPQAKTGEGRAREISMVGGRGRTIGRRVGEGRSDKRRTQQAYDIKGARADKRGTKAPRVKTDAQKKRDAAAKVKARAAATEAGASLTRAQWRRSAGRRRKELTLVNPILGKVMEATHERVASSLLTKHKELFVANQAASAYAELVAYKAEKQAAVAQPDKGEYDEEGGMAKSQLKSVIRNAKSIHDKLQDDTNIAEWVQSKITVAEDYISTVANYMQGEVEKTASKEAGVPYVKHTDKAKRADQSAQKPPAESKSISASVRVGLQRKVVEHNEKFKDEPNKRVTFSMLERVFRRGVGAYQTNPGSVRPNVTGPDQWAYARVNAFLSAIRSGKYKSGKFDVDILPKKHPLSSRKTTKESDDIELRKSLGNISHSFRFAFQKFASTEKERRGSFGIHIDPENIGKFTATKKRTGKTTEELTHSKNPLTKKRAVFAENAARWSK